MLYYQLKSAKLPASVEKERDAVQELKQAARGLKVLLVLDDCWEEKHAQLLNCVDPEAGSACVITTRIRNLGDGEISCGLLSVEESLSLLLTSAGLEHLVDNPPAAALEAVECCGRLALALPIAGGMIRELEEVWETGEPFSFFCYCNGAFPFLAAIYQYPGMVLFYRTHSIVTEHNLSIYVSPSIKIWEWRHSHRNSSLVRVLLCLCILRTALVPMIKQELSEETSVEQRIVDASLRCVEQSQQAGVEALFTIFGCFAEDEVVPATALELLAPIVCERAGNKATSIKVRKWLSSLLRASLLSGSGAKGVHVHDLVRDVMIARAEAGTGGMVGLQVCFSRSFARSHSLSISASLSPLSLPPTPSQTLAAVRGRGLGCGWHGASEQNGA